MSQLKMRKKTDQEPLSKSAAKNKKRREAAKKKKDDDDNVSNQGNKAQSVQNNLNITSTGAKCDNGKLSSDPETEKKLRKLNDKLTAIQKLKVQQKEGKQLEKNQIEKISKEQEIIDEIQKLKL